MALTLYPAIDIKEGRVVRLLQGKADQVTAYHEDPAAPARQYKEAGARWIHVVDLDGAFTGKLSNLEALKRIISAGLKVQFGGGVRELETIETALNLGVRRVVMGTRAACDVDFVRAAVQTFGDAIAVGIDARNGQVAIKGWVETTNTTVLELAKRMEDCGVSTVIYTDITTDGMLQGPNFDGQEDLLRSVSMRCIASGGVASTEDVLRFAEMKKQYPNLDGVIVGKAIYAGRINLNALLLELQRPQ